MLKKPFLIEDIIKAINQNKYLLLILISNGNKKFVLIVPENLGAKLTYYKNNTFYNDDLVYKNKRNCYIDTWAIGDRQEIITELKDEMILYEKNRLKNEEGIEG